MPRQSFHEQFIPPDAPAEDVPRITKFAGQIVQHGIPLGSPRYQELLTRATEVMRRLRQGYHVEGEVELAFFPRAAELDNAIKQRQDESGGPPFYVENRIGGSGKKDAVAVLCYGSSRPLGASTDEFASSALSSAESILSPDEALRHINAEVVRHNSEKGSGGVSLAPVDLSSMTSQSLNDLHEHLKKWYLENAPADDLTLREAFANFSGRLHDCFQTLLRQCDQAKGNE